MQLMEVNITAEECSEYNVIINYEIVLLMSSKATYNKLISRTCIRLTCYNAGNAY